MVRVLPSWPRKVLVRSACSAQTGRWCWWWVACGQRAGVTHADHRAVRGRGAGEFQAERAGGVGEPAVVRGAEVQRLGAFGQQVEDVAVVALDLRCRSRFGVQVGVDGGEEVGKAAGAGAGGQDALLIVAELGPEQVEFAVLLVFVDLGQQLRLSTARSSCIALGGRRADMMQTFSLRANRLGGKPSRARASGAAF